MATFHKHFTHVSWFVVAMLLGCTDSGVIGTTCDPQCSGGDCVSDLPPCHSCQLPSDCPTHLSQCHPESLVCVQCMRDGDCGRDEDCENGTCVPDVDDDIDERDDASD